MSGFISADFLVYLVFGFNIKMKNRNITKKELSLSKVQFFWTENLKKKDSLVDLRVDGRIILKYVYKNVFGFDSFGTRTR